MNEENRENVPLIEGDDLNINLLADLELNGREPRTRNEHFFQVTIPLYNDDLFKEHFRISRAAFQASYERSRRFPGVVGAIDGCHVPIKQPEGNEHDYYNRKGFSIILQGTCDHMGKFIDCYIGMPGRIHDSRVLRNSPFFQRLTSENPLLPPNMHIIGDSAYPLLPNVMVPFRDTGHLTEAQIRYNVKLSSIRSIIERVFGILKNKFRRLKFLDVATSEFSTHIIAAGCVLYNFLIMEGDINLNEEQEHPELETIVGGVEDENFEVEENAAVQTKKKHDL